VSTENAPLETPDGAAATATTQTTEIPVDSTPPTRRGPGRPSNAEKAARAAAAAGVKSEKVGAAPKVDKPSKRGAKMSADALNALAKQIQGIHAMAAMMSGIGILQISNEEAGLLAHGISAVSEEYGLALDGKTGAALQLFGAAAMVYAPRVLQIAAMRKAAQKNAPVDATVVG